MAELKVYVDMVNNNISEVINIIALALGPILGLIISSIIQHLQKKREHRVACNRVESEKIKSDLENFYYPVLALVRKNKILYDIFNKDKKDFRTLLELVKNFEFNKNDKALLNKIIEIDKEINSLIFKNKHIINDKGKLSEVINNASVHFTLMEMAFDRQINGEEKRFSEYVYPRELEQVLVDKIIKLDDELSVLQKDY